MSAKKYLISHFLQLKPEGKKDTSTGDFYRLDEICDIYKGSGLSKGDISELGTKQCIVYGELFTTYDETIERVFSKTNTELGFEAKFGDVLMPTATTTVAVDLAKASALLVDSVWIGGDAIILRPNKSRVSSEYLAYTLTHSHRREISARAQGSTIVHLSKGDIENLRIFLPPLDEQIKIAKILKGADSILTRVSKNLLRLRTERDALSNSLLKGNLGSNQRISS